MRRGKRLFLAIILLAVVCLVAARAFRTRGPHYRGRSLSSWTERLGSSLGEPNPEAEEAIRGIGTNALPYLLKWITQPSESHPFRAAVDRTVFRLPDFPGNGRILNWARQDPEENLADGAALAIGALGTNAQAVVPELFRLMNSPGSDTNLVSSRCYSALAYCHTDSAMPMYLAQLANTNAPNRKDAAFLIACCPLETNADLAITALVHYLKDGDVSVIESALGGLSRMCEKHTAAKTVLARAMDEGTFTSLTNALVSSGNVRLRSRAIRFFCTVGPPLSTPVQLSLLSVLGDQNPTLRRQAVRSIPRLGLWATNALPILTNLLDQAQFGEIASNSIYLISAEVRSNALQCAATPQTSPP